MMPVLSYSRKRNRKIGRTLIIIFSILSIILILFASEIIYMINNPENKLIPYLINMSRKSINNGNPDNSIYLIDLSSYLLIKNNAKVNKGIKFANYFPLQKRQLNDEGRKIIVNTLDYYFNNISISNVKENLSYIYYLLFLNFYKEGNINLAKNCIDNIVYINPQLPQYQIERLNFYFILGEEENAKSTLNFCQLFDISKFVCQDFYKEYIDNSNRPSVGFYNESIIDHLTRNANYIHKTGGVFPI